MRRATDSASQLRAAISDTAQLIGEELWDGKTETGSLAPPGIYVYHMEVARSRRDGKFVVAR